MITTQQALIAGAVAAAGSVIAVELVGAIGKAAGAEHIAALTAPALATLTIVGVAVATAAWVLIGRRPGGARLLSRLVPAVLIVSFVPDLALGLAGQGWAAVLTLMIAHAAVFAVTIPVLRTMLVATPEPSLSQV
jgi:hypothetical protein